MSGLTIKIEGLRELDAALADLGKSMSRTVMRRAAVTALTPIVEDAKARVIASTNGTGKLAESLTVSTQLSRNQRREARRATKSYFEIYAGAGALPEAHLLEWGTGLRFQRDPEKSVGFMPAEPFLRPAWDAFRSELPKVVGAELWAELRKAAARKAKRAARLARRS